MKVKISDAKLRVGGTGYQYHPVSIGFQVLPDDWLPDLCSLISEEISRSIHSNRSLTRLRVMSVRKILPAGISVSHDFRANRPNAVSSV